MSVETAVTAREQKCITGAIVCQPASDGGNGLQHHLTSCRTCVALMRDRDISVERPSSGSEQMSHGGYFIWTFSEPHLCTTAIVGVPAINNIVSEFDCNNNTATDYYYNQILKCCHECSCIFFIVKPSTSMLGKNIGVRSPPHVGS